LVNHSMELMRWMELTVRRTSVLVMGLDVQAQRDGQCALDESAHKHEPFFAWDTPASIDQVADETAKGARPDVEETVDCGDLTLWSANVTGEEEWRPT
jgi:hypothetical protein